MDLYEYQAKDLFAAHGVPVLPGRTVDTAADAEAAAGEIGGAVVVKAQVKVGGRGKAGGVKLAESPAEAKEKAEKILGLDIKGHVVHRVLVTEASDIAEEYYFSFLLDRSNRTFLAMASAEGGMEIEELAVERPEALARVPIDAIAGVDKAKADEIVAQAKLPAEVADEAAEVIVKLWDTFVGEDATLVEVNPLVRDPQDKIIALDGKVTLDENADFRHEAHAALVDERTENPLEAKAKAKGLNYVKLDDGQVGIIGNGAGLVMSTLDVVAYAGEQYGGMKPANFLDIGGGASAEIMAAGLDVILGDSDVRSVFVNVFGGITACDAVANGIVEALKILGDDATKPLVVRLDGNNVDEGRRILAEANHPLVTVVGTMDDAAAKAAELAAASAEPAIPRRLVREMSIFLNENSKVIVQGLTGSEGMKHGRKMLAAGTQLVGGVNARKAGTSVDVDGTSVPVYGGVEEAMKETGADVSVLFVPPKFAKDAAVEAIDAGIGLAVVITEGIPVHDSAWFWAHACANGNRTRIIGPNCPGIISPRQVARRHHPGEHLGPREDGPGVEVGHADLPDDVRAP